MGRDFVHLHLHSEYSLLDGACRIRNIAAAAKKCGQTAVALTDHGNMYGAVEFYRAAKKEGIKPIIGCEVYVAPASRHEKEGAGHNRYYHLVLLVKNEIGYKNLIYMVSKGYTEGFYSKPRIDMELLSHYSDGLIALSGCIAGLVPQCIIANNYTEAKRHALEMRDIFGAGNYYLEVQNHGIEQEKIAVEGLVRISSETGIPLVATNDIHYIAKEDAEIQTLLTCIQTNNVVSDGNPVGFSGDDYYFKTTDEMYSLFPELAQACANTAEIASKCNFDFDFNRRVFPYFEIPAGKTAAQYLRDKADEGYRKRIGKGEIHFDDFSEDEYKKRTDYELSVIESMGYCEYFLIVADFVCWAKDNLIPTGPGRGSGASSLVAYLLGITDVDSLKYNLLFEAFLNPERVSMPDFDIDFCYFRREEVIKYVTEKYGDDHVSQITTFGTMAARAAVRDVGRALGMSYNETDSVAKLIPRELKITLDAALETDELKKLYESSDKVKKLLDCARAIEGMPRHASTHAAGVVITDRPIYEYVPLSTNGDTVVTQYDMNTIADLGLLKFDFLGLRYLTILSDAEKYIREREPEFSLTAIPQEDNRTFSLISAGRTYGVFQLESAGMRQMLSRMRPKSVHDIMTAIALYRPGPMKFIDSFIANREHPEKIKYKIPTLNGILKETYGCIVYQEQVMEIFRAVAGYSYGRADIVRRAISKKKADVIAHEKDAFVAGAVSQGATEQDALSLYDDMTGFANYGFKKSHAAAYGLISYKCAYLKANYTAQYFAALLTNEEGSEKIPSYISDCARFGIKVLSPDINESNSGFTVTNDGNIRYGLLALKNIGLNFINRLIHERENRPFTSFADFAKRMSGREMNKKQCEALIKVGAFDSLGISRSSLLVSFEEIVDIYSTASQGGVEGQMSLLGAGDGNAAQYEYPPMPEFTLREKLMLEKEVSGLYFSGHILDEYSNHLSTLKYAIISDIISSADTDNPMYTDRQNVRICGLITKRTNKTTRAGADMAIISIDDGTGEMEALVFADTLKASSYLLTLDSAVVLTGTLSFKEDESPKLTAVKNVVPLTENSKFKRPESPVTEKPKKLFVRVEKMDSDKAIRALSVIKIFSGRTEVVFYDKEQNRYERMTNMGADIESCLIKELVGLLGEENVVLK